MVTVLQARGITKHFGGIVALGDASVTVQRGEVHAILGENGAGKSTFAKILSGATSPDGGMIEIDGRAYTPKSPQDAYRMGVATAFQHLSLVPDLTVAENLWSGQSRKSRFRPVARREVYRKSAELLARFDVPGIDPRAEVRDLSLATRQVLEVVKALAESPDTLILDESTAPLSPKESQWVLDLAMRAAEGGARCIFISHRMPEVRRVATVATVLRNGYTVGRVKLAEVTDDELVEMMLGRRLARLFPPRISTVRANVALSVRDLRYATRLADVTFDLREGEILGVGGLQGQGQRELFLGLFGVLHVRGNVAVRGRPVTIRHPSQALSAGIGLGLVPEDRQREGLLLTKSIAENVALAGRVGRSGLGLVNAHQDDDTALAAVESLQVVYEDLDQHVGRLSGGNQQKVLIAKMLQTRAKILLLYDLTRGVDVGTKHEIYELMRRLASDGYSLLFFSTDTAELVNVADRVIVMRDGTITAEIPAEQLTEDRVVAASVSAGEWNRP
jgi:ribose transport system ATP-binding protein